MGGGAEGEEGKFPGELLQDLRRKFIRNRGKSFDVELSEILFSRP